MFDSNYQTNYWLGFPDSNSDIILNLTHWQYWWWFWFTYLLCLYYLLFLKLVRFRLLKFHPKIVTSYKSRGKWGDFAVCLLPVTWCVNILSNSNFILRMLEWQTESSLFTVRIRGKQWYWIYKFEIKTLLNINNISKNIGNNKWYSPQDFNIDRSEDYLNVMQLKENLKWVKKYLSKQVKAFKRKKPYHFTTKQGGLNLTNYFTKKDEIFYKNFYINKFNSHVSNSRVKNRFSAYFSKKKVPLFLRNFKKFNLDCFDIKTKIHFIKDNAELFDFSKQIIRLNKTPVTYRTLPVAFSDILKKVCKKGKIRDRLTVVQKYYSLNAENEVNRRWKELVKGRARHIKNNKLLKFDLFLIRFKSRWSRLPNPADFKYNYFKNKPAKNLSNGSSFTPSDVLSTNAFDLIYKASNVDTQSKKVERHIRFNYFGASTPFKFDFINNEVYSRFNHQNDAIMDKNLPDNLYLVIKQKRFIPIKTLDYFKNQSMVLVNNRLFELMNSDKNLTKKVFKTLKKKPQNFHNLFHRRLLRTKRILVLPTNVNITLITNSFDVVHSWFIPGLGIKLDCVPGRSTHHTINIDHAGFYYGQCAEICGRHHHHMPIRVCALPFEHFLVWWYQYGIPYFNAVGTTRRKSIKSGIKQYSW